VHSWGNAMVPAMLKSGLNPIKILVLPKGIDFSKFYFTNHFISGMPNELTAIVTRSLSKDYDHHVIIKAVDILKKIGIRLKLIIIGDGPLNDQLQYLTKKFNIDDQINFIGRIDNAELPHYLSQSHLYLSTPVTEGASSSLMEAMAAGCFPIVTNLPGNKSFIENGKNGILVDVGSPKSLADAILKLNNKFCEKAVIYNRLYAEQKMNKEANMQLFWNKYKELVFNIS
jgi:glycosyltransferase involved in cell wall biosynthesis